MDRFSYWAMDGAPPLHLLGFTVAYLQKKRWLGMCANRGLDLLKQPAARRAIRLCWRKAFASLPKITTLN